LSPEIKPAFLLRINVGASGINLRVAQSLRVRPSVLVHFSYLQVARDFILEHLQQKVGLDPHSQASVNA